MWGGPVAERAIDDRGQAISVARGIEYWIIQCNKVNIEHDLCIDWHRQSDTTKTDMPDRCQLTEK